MSQWTHFAATIRFDAIRLIPGMEKLVPDLGNTCTFDSDPSAWEACTVPKGSEGSLQYHIWSNPEKNHLAAFTTMIWGDLRDYSNVDELIAYLERITQDKMVRQGVAEIQVEGDLPIVLQFNCGTKKWQRLSVIKQMEQDNGPSN